MGPQCVGGVAWMSKPGPVNPAHTHACTDTHTCVVKISTLHAYSQSYVRALHVLTVHTHLRIYRQTMQTHAHKYMWRTQVFALSQSKGTLSTAVMWETSLMANASFLEPSREKSHNESEVAEVSLLAVQIVITCTASNVKIIHDCTIFMFCSDGERAEVSQNSLQHINSCLRGSCWHTTLSVWKYPKVMALLGTKVIWTMTEVTFEACCVTCVAFSPWHL